MSNFTESFSYSIGKKLIMGLTGLFLVTFLIAHLSGNLTMFSGPGPFAAYAHFMGSNILIRVAEIGLFAFLLFHIIDGYLLARQNKKARPVGYAVANGKSAPWYSKTMHWTGSVMLAFLVLHLISFFLFGRFGIDVPIGEMPVYKEWALDGGFMNVYNEYPHETELYIKSVHHFQMWWYTGIYVLAMLFIGFHLNHGFQSAFTTLGIDHPRYKPAINALGTFLAVILPAGFAAIPLYFLIDHLM